MSVSQHATIIMSIVAIASTGVCLVLSQSRLREKNTSLSARLNTDALTGILNRKATLQLLADYIEQQISIHLLYIDLTNFKAVNDSHGYLIGDRLLRTVAERLSCVKPIGAQCGRLGGDEFCLIVPDFSRSGIMTLLDRLWAAEIGRLNVDGKEISTPLSIGIADNNSGKIGADELVRRADLAMHEAKRDGKGRAFYDPKLDQEQMKRHRIGTDLLEALKSNCLELHYQPIINARSGYPDAFEALMRWPSKNGRPGISPAEFIPIAEETGLIVELGEWTLRTAVKQIKRNPRATISINVSARQLITPNFVRSVACAVRDAGINPGHLKIELTESALIEHTDLARKALSQLKSIGVQTMLDDFGTGFSSLSYLQEFDFDALKIDRAFTKRLDEEKSNLKLLRSIVQMGHSLGMQVIVEGVETPIQVAALQLIHVDLLQGFLLGVPKPELAFESFDFNDRGMDRHKSRLVG